MTKTCWLTIDDDSKFNSSSPSNQVIGSAAYNSSNPMVSFGSASAVSVYLCRNSGLSGGSFRLGIWNSDTTPKQVSSTFTAADIDVGTSYADCVEVQKGITSASVSTSDIVGIECVTAPSGSGEIFIGTENPSASEWSRIIFIDSSGSYDTNNNGRGIKVCLDTTSPSPPPSSGGTRLPPPPLIARF